MRIGVDLGGTKIEIIALDDAGVELQRKRVATPQGDYWGILNTIAQLINDVETATNQRGSIGIGTPGALSPATGLMRNSNSVCLNGKPVKTDLENLLQRSIRMANDANCFALSEATDGAAQGAAVVFGVIIGTGTGAGVVVNQQVLTGPNAIAGEWGHNPLPWPRDDERPGPVCYCGKRGCIETFLSGPGLEHDYQLATGEKIRADEIVSRAEKHEVQAEQCLQRYENRMARALAHIINVLDPDIIVLGGGMSNVQRLYKNVPAIWGQYVFSATGQCVALPTASMQSVDVVQTRLVPPRFGDSSGVRGAAWL